MAWTTDSDGNQYWLDDYVAPADNGDSIAQDQGMTQEQYDRGQADAMGLTYEQYLEISGTGGNVTDENQSAAETARLAQMSKDHSVNGLGNISPGHDITANPEQSTWDKIATSLKLKDPNTGEYDWSKILALAGTGIATIGAATQTPVKQLSLAELKAGMPTLNTPPAWTEAELAYGRRPMQSGSALQRVYAADMQQPMAAGQTTAKMADGGEVMPGEMGEAPGALSQAFAGAVQGSEGGQSDMVSAMLSPGEYVLDAETVSALGDGNTAAGIAKLDELRAKLRSEKRSAPTDSIPQQAQGPLSYMQGA